MKLYITELPRWMRLTLEDVRGVTYLVPFRDETRKTTTAKWRMKRLWHHGNLRISVLFRLDGRSIRYMKRVKVIECCEL
jgi:hypothetical protein